MLKLHHKIKSQILVSIPSKVWWTIHVTLPFNVHKAMFLYNIMQIYCISTHYHVKASVTQDLMLVFSKVTCVYPDISKPHILFFKCDGHENHKV